MECLYLLFSHPCNSCKDLYLEEPVANTLKQKFSDKAKCLDIYC